MIIGSLIVSASKARVVGTVALKLADWYIKDSLEEAHCMLPPRLSTSSKTSSDVRDLVDLKARRSMI